MGNLSKLIIAGLAAIILNKGIAQEPGKTLYVSEQQIEYYKKEPNKSDMIFKTGYLDVNKKVTLAYGYEHSKYINMINPESIIDFTSRINSMGRSNTQIANQFFYILRTKGVKYEPDPVDPCYIEITNKKNEEFLQDYAEYLAARILSGESGHIIFCAPTKDYLKDPSQTLEKNKDGVLEGGDCEDLAALLATCIASKTDIYSVALSKFYKTDSLGRLESHVSFLFRIQKDETEKSKYKIIFPDSSIWIPLEATEIGKESTFEEAVEKGFNNFVNFQNFIILRFKENKT